MTDYALWEVIVNGESPPPKRIVDGVQKTYPPTTAEEKLARKNELKARGSLLMALPNEHQLKFNTYKCAKSLMEAIEKRFGGNKESRKTQKTLLKQQYENFNGSSSEGLNQTYDRLQKLISQLEILGETISQKDMNLKFLKSLTSEWKTYTLIWRNKPDLDTLSMDDLYNNLKIYETEVKGSSSSNQNSQNVAFESSNNSGSSNQAHGSNSVNTDKMDLKWQMVMLTMRARIFLNKTGRKISANGSETIEINKSKVECYKLKQLETKALVAQDGLGYDWSDQDEEGPTNFTLMAYTSSGSSSSSSSDSEVSTCSKASYKACLESAEARLDVYKKNEAVFKEDIKILKLDVMLRDNALTELRKKFEKAEKERDDLKLTLEKFGNSFKNLSKRLDSKVCDKFKTSVGFDSQVVDSQVFDSQENDMYKTSEGYHVVPPPYTRNFMPPKSDLVLVDEDEYVFIWISDSEDENETEPKSKSSFAKVEFVKSNEHEKTPKECVKKVGNNKQAKYPSKNSQSPRGNQKNWNNLMTQKLGSNFEFKNKACYVCGSFNHLIKDCDFYEKNTVEKLVWNNARMVNHQNSQRLAHPHPKRNFVSRAVLMKSGLKTLNTARQNSSRAAISVTTARPINTAHPRPTVNCARPVSNVFNKAHSHVRRPFNKLTSNKNSNFNEKVNTVRGNVTTVKPKAVGNPQLELHDKGVIDSGCSRHMTRNKSYLSDYEEIDGNARSTVLPTPTTEAKKAKRPTEISQSSGPIPLVADETVIKEWEDILKEVGAGAAQMRDAIESGTSSGSGPRCEDTILGDAAAQIRFEAASKQSNNPPLSRVNTLGSGEDSMKLKELMELCIEQLWVTAKAKTVNGEHQIQALVDKKKVIITKKSVRSDLKLKDAEGTECLPNDAIFERLTLMGYENLTQKLTFYKAYFSSQWKFLIHIILQCLIAKTTAWNEFSSTMASAIICLATNQNFNFSKYIFDNMMKNLKGGVKFLMYPRFVQIFLDKQVEGMSKHKGIYVTPSHIKKVFANMKRPGKDFPGKVIPLFQTMMVQAPEDMEPIPNEATNDESISTHSYDPPQSGEDRLQLTELMSLCTKLQKQVLDLEEVKTAQTKEIASLKKRVKQLEKRKKSRTSWLKRLRKVGSASRTQGRNDKDLMFDNDVLNGDEVFKEPIVNAAKTTSSISVSAADPITTAGEVVTTASATTIVDELTLA
ncbi:ribonuclease H-like domain-containing protein [Tanacetum coccineum]